MTHSSPPTSAPKEILPSPLAAISLKLVGAITILAALIDFFDPAAAASIWQSGLAASDDYPTGGSGHCATGGHCAAVYGLLDR